MRIDGKQARSFARLLAGVEFNPGGCWNWAGKRTVQGYGTAKWEGRQQGAHRVFWQIFFGPIPKTIFVCHHCDNPACVRPDHLFLGTSADNYDDGVRKGRMTNGMKLTYRLTEIQVTAIEERLDAYQTQKSIAEEFGLPIHVVSRIALRYKKTRAKRRERWLQEYKAEQQKEQVEIKESEAKKKSAAKVKPIPTRPPFSVLPLSPWVRDIIEKSRNGDSIDMIARVEGVPRSTISNILSHWST